jgi:predicted transcriptional regulator
MIMKKLEERDLIVREKFGKTYKVYLSEWIGGERNREGGKFSSTSSPL